MDTYIKLFCDLLIYKLQVMIYQCFIDIIYKYRLRLNLLIDPCYSLISNHTIIYMVITHYILTNPFYILHKTWIITVIYIYMFNNFL